ncbi:hypothetical protein KA005_74370, partial [bacterium]|nr:hypothetical protein [bacterium]
DYKINSDGDTTYRIGTNEQIKEVMDKYGDNLPSSVIGLVLDWFGKLFGFGSEKEYHGAYVPQTDETWISKDTLKDTSLLYKVIGHEDAHRAKAKGWAKLPSYVDEEVWADEIGELYASKVSGRN